MGYNTASLTGGKFNMSGIVFSNVDGTAIDLNDMTFENLTSGDEANNADKIQVWDPATSGYTTFFNYNLEGDEESWGWWDENFEVDPVLPVGTAFWYKAKAGNGKAMTHSGAVESDTDVTVAITGGKFNMVINPYPTTIDLNDDSTVEFTNLTSGDEANNADKIQVWDPATSGYTTFFNYNLEGDEESWGWWDENFEVDPVLPAGTAFWYKAKAGSGKAITFKKTY